MAKRGALEHPKTLTLADELGIMDCFALGIVEAFWQHVAKYHEDGDVTALKPGAMARSIRYTGDANALWDALITAKFLDVLDDGRILVHDWSEHADDSVHTRLYRAVRRFADGVKPKSRSVGTTEKAKLDILWTSENRPTDAPPKPKPKPKPLPKPDEDNNPPSPQGGDTEDKPSKEADRTWVQVLRELKAQLPESHHQAVKDWCIYASQRKPKFHPWAEITVRTNSNRWKNWPAERLVAAIEHTIASSWQGIKEPDKPFVRGKHQAQPENPAPQITDEDLDRLMNPWKYLEEGSEGEGDAA